MSVGKPLGEMTLEELWDLYEHDRDGYTRQKADFVREHTRRAKEEFENHFIPIR